MFWSGLDATFIFFAGGESTRSIAALEWPPTLSYGPVAMPLLGQRRRELVVLAKTVLLSGRDGSHAVCMRTQASRHQRRSCSEPSGWRAT
eukprot:COSAG06_NODE_22291_length_728_cov_1.166932_1_plen_89_part_10